MERKPANPSPDVVAFTASVRGRVQGVGFRWSAVERAERLGVSGWVRNEYDGSVSCHCEGSRAALERYLDWLKRGPPGAYVAEVEVSWGAASGTFRGFAVDF